jgi:hypothetical protein
MDGISKAERDELLARLRLVEAEIFGDESDDYTPERLRALEAVRKELRAGYLRTLPRIDLGRCPFDESMTLKGMDVYGLNGPWWDVQWADVPAHGDSHFVTYLGAIDLGGTKLDGVASGRTAEIRPGPGVPYVVPRLLGMKGVRCVLKSTRLFDGAAVAYFMSYYSETRFPSEASHQEWLRQTYWYRNSENQLRWNAANDSWDFDLERWLSQPDKLYWIAPDDPPWKLRSGPYGCPFVGLRGVRQPQIIHNGRVRTGSTPDGSQLEPFE